MGLTRRRPSCTTCSNSSTSREPSVDQVSRSATQRPHRHGGRHHASTSAWPGGRHPGPENVRTRLGVWSDTANMRPVERRSGLRPGRKPHGHPALHDSGSRSRQQLRVCRADFVVSERGGPQFGYAVGEIQRIGLRVGLPANTSDGGTGGGAAGEGAWNGKVRNLGGGGLAGAVGSVTAATNGRSVGSATDGGHTGTDPSFGVIQATHDLNLGKMSRTSSSRASACSISGRCGWPTATTSSPHPETTGTVARPGVAKASSLRRSTGMTSTGSSSARPTRATR